jgi:hypothetical protein
MAANVPGRAGAFDRRTRAHISAAILSTTARRAVETKRRGDLTGAARKRDLGFAFRRLPLGGDRHVVSNLAEVRQEWPSDGSYYAQGRFEGWR